MKKVFLVAFIVSISYFLFVVFGSEENKQAEKANELSFSMQESIENNEEENDEKNEEKNKGKDESEGNKKSEETREKINNQEESQRAKFLDDFSKDYTLEESGKMEKSDSSDWWVNSGAFLYVENGTGKTIFNDLEKGSYWQEKYKDYDASETDEGRHPQNIFRLVLRSKWKNFTQECHYNIHNYIMSDAKERSQSNGILLFNRYLDGDNLYYTGLRVDGTVVVKKKYKGEYYTMAQESFYPGVYDRENEPNLTPLNSWIGVRSEVQTLAEGKVLIKLLIDQGHNGEWEQVIEVEDDGKSFGGDAILQEGYAGIRTDFMDVEFDDYKIEEMKE